MKKTKSSLFFLLPIFSIFLILSCTTDERSNIFDPNGNNFLGDTNPDEYEKVKDYLSNSNDSSCVQMECLDKAKALDSLISISINNLINNTTIGSKVILLSGRFHSTNSIQFITITVNDTTLLGADINVNAKTWSKQVTLELGTNSIEIQIGDTENNSVLKTITVTYEATAKDETPPILRLTHSDTATSSPYSISGVVIDQSGASVKLISPYNADMFMPNDTTWSTLVDLSPGSNTFVVQASDPDTNTVSLPFSVYFDYTPLSVNISSPANWTTYSSNNTSPTVTVVTSGSLQADSVLVNGQKATRSGNNWNTSVQLTLNDTTEVIAVAYNSRDTARDTTYLLHSTNTNDNQGPTITLVSPANNATIPGSSALVRIKVKDESGIQSVTLNQGNETTNMTKVNDSIYEGTVNLTVGQVANFTIVAKDASLFSNTSNKTYGLVGSDDTAGPSFTFQSHEDSGIISNKTPTVQFRVSDPAGVELPVQINGSNSTFDAEEGVASKQIVLNDNGYTKITIGGRDSLGNTSQKDFYLKYDGAGPYVQISPEDGSTLYAPQVQIVVQATDSSGISGVFINDKEANFSSNSYRLTVNLREGSNNISIKAVDNAEPGNETEGSITLTMVDTTAPVIEGTDPAQDETVYTLNPTIQVNAQDASGISKVTINGVEATRNGEVFEAAVSVHEGRVSIPIVVTDSGQNANQTTDTLVFNAVDQVGPTINIVAPLADTIYDQAFTTVQISVQDPSQIEGVTIGGIEATLTDNYYQVTTSLVAGLNNIVLIATDGSEAQNSTTDTLTIFRYVSVTEISITEMHINLGDTAAPEITWTPSNATNKGYTLLPQVDPQATVLVTSDSTKLIGNTGSVLPEGKQAFVELVPNAPEAKGLDNRFFSVYVHSNVINGN